jgi:uncharacterized membrane protein
MKLGATTQSRGQRGYWLAATAGALGMYFLDPADGARRRSYLRDKIIRADHVSRDILAKASRDFAHRVRGVAAAMARAIRAEHVSPAVLVDRVRAELGHVVSLPHAIRVDVDEGTVTLSGAILAGERSRVLGRVRRVSGVRRVLDALEPHRATEGMPALQGGARSAQRNRRRFAMAQENWPPSLRVGAMLMGTAVSGWGARRRRGWPAAITIAGGAALVLRAVTNLPMNRLLGAGAGRRAIDFHKTIAVAAPIDEVFAVFADFERFPRFMNHVRDVQMTGEGRSRWTVQGPANVPVSFDVESTELVPKQKLAWKTSAGSGIEHAGVVSFEEQGDGVTRLDVRMSYNPVFGALGHVLARWFRVDPKRALDEDLVRFKSLLEDGKTRAHRRTVTRGEIEESTATGPGR